MSDKLKKMQQDMIAAMKSGNKVRKDVISMAIGRTKLIAKNDKNREPTDNDVVTAISKSIKETSETLSFVQGEKADILNNEIAILNEYMPTTLSNEELRVEIFTALQSTVDNKGARGVAMKHLSENFKGQYDPKDAMEIIAELIASEEPWK